MSLLSVEGAVAGYGAAEEILKGTSIRVEPGEIVTVIGPNGAGKSTLLKAVAGLLPLKSGEISFEGNDVTRENALGRARAGLAFVPQERNVFGTLTVDENLVTSAFLWPSAARGRADALYDRYPMLATKRRQLARTLSGGQRQILAMAMGLMTEPRLMLLDEPTAGLSPSAADDLFDAIVTLNKEGMPVLMVEQHAVEALAVSHRGYVVVSGRTEAEGAGEQLAADPDIRRLFLGG